MLAPNQKRLFDEIDILPIDLKTKIVERILTSMAPSSGSIDALWTEEATRRMTEVENGEVALVDGNAVFEKLSKRLKS